MTRFQARIQMSKGLKLTHTFFTAEEWVTMLHSNSDIYLFEDGVKLTEQEFWQHRSLDGWLDGWELFNDKKQDK